MALYAPWWQFETWLRDVMYVELVALLGPSWRGEIKAKYLDYMKHDDLVHMRTADNTALITYTDFGFLLKLVDDWNIVGDTAVPITIFDTGSIVVRDRH